MTVPAQNTTRAPKRAPGRPWKPGESGNPGGRPKGLAAAVREKAPAEELAAYMLAIWQMDRAALAKFKIPLKQVTLAERTKAHEWLSERGYGKAAAYAPVEGGDPLELSELDRAITTVLDELAARREDPAAGEGEGAALAETG